MMILPLLLTLVFLVLLAAVSLIDWNTMEIPDKLSAAVLAVGILAALWDWFGMKMNLSQPEVTLYERLLGLFCVSLPMEVLIRLIPGSFGGGDVKLMAGIGFFLGWKNCLLGFVLAVIGGGSYGGWLLLAGKKSRKDHFAFGPFLCAGAAASCLFGGQILAWYLG